MKHDGCLSSSINLHPRINPGKLLQTDEMLAGGAPRVRVCLLRVQICVLISVVSEVLLVRLGRRTGWLINY